MNLTDALSEDWIYALKETKGCCAYCGVPLIANRMFYATMQLDHIFPVSQFPELGSAQANLIAACSFCNSAKGKYVVPHSDPTQILDDPEKRKAYIRQVALNQKLSIQRTMELYRKQEEYYLTVLSQLLPQFQDTDTD